MKNKARIATRFERTCAFLIDIFLLYVPILYTFYFILGSKKAFLENELIIFFCWLIFGLLQALFFVKSAQSPGLKAYELYLIDMKTNKKCSFSKIVLRYILFIFTSALIFGLVTSLFRKDALTAYDLISKTYIVKKI